MVRPECALYAHRPSANSDTDTRIDILVGGKAAGRVQVGVW